MSGTKRLLLAVAMLGLGVRCIIVPVHRTYVPPPPATVVITPPPAHHATPPPAQPVPPPPPRYISEGDAINIGIRYCQSRAYPCDLQNAHLTGDGVWKVKLKVRGYGEDGRVHMDIDARNGSMIRVDEKLKERGGRGHDH
jgi:hypothetical protein